MNQFPMNLQNSGRMPEAGERDALLAEVEKYQIPDVLLVAADGATPEEVIPEIVKEVAWMPVGVMRWEQGVGPASRSLALLLQYMNMALPRTRIHLAGYGQGAHVAAAAATSCLEPVLATLTLVRPSISPFTFASHGAMHRLMDQRLVQGPTVVLFERKTTAVGMGRTGAHGLEERDRVLVENVADVEAQLQRRVINLVSDGRAEQVAVLLRILCCRGDTVPPLRRAKPVRRSTRSTGSHRVSTPAGRRAATCPGDGPSTGPACSGLSL